MRPRKFIAMVMTFLMMLSLLPSMVFAAAAPAGELGGKLKIKGKAAVGTELSADYSKATPEGLTDEYVSFLWSRKVGDEITEVGTEKTYKLTEEDLGNKIELKVTGLAEMGVTGELKAHTVEIVATPEEAPEETTEEDENDPESINETPDGENQETEETPNEDAAEIPAEEPSSEDNAEVPSVETPSEDNTEVPSEKTSAEGNTEASSEETPSDVNTDGNDEDGVIVIGGEEPSDSSTDTMQPSDESSENQNTGTSDGDTSGISTDDSVIDIGNEDYLEVPADGQADTSSDSDGQDDNADVTYDASAVYGDGTSNTVEFDPVQEGFTNTDNEYTKSVTIKNTGTGTLHFKKIAPDHFMVKDIEDPLAAGESIEVWIMPREGLTASDSPYSDVITYETEEGKSVSFNASVVVNPAPEPTATPEPTEAPEPTATPEPTEAPEPTATPEPTEAPEPTATPEPTEAPEPTEIPDITMIPEVKVTSLTALDGTGIASINLAYGAEKSLAGLQLPATIKISTSDGERDASVTWDVNGCAYNPSSSETQTFSVNGLVTLPDGVSNPDNISLVVAANVTVNRGAIVSDASQNTITGISSDGSYTTETKITFNAVGAGMNIEKPINGDVRYLPLNWEVLETRSWDGAPYSATFRMGKSGNYTLTVTYNQQKFDGSNWVNTGTQDTKQVNFTVAAAPNQTLTPAVNKDDANKKNAVKTGDNTPILPFVIILVIAVVLIAGILVYRNKKK